jgi:hypothetical protein
MVVRSLYGYQDETGAPWYLEYLSLGREIGLIGNESNQILEKTPITREKLATWLYTAFMYSSEEQYDKQDSDA